MARRRRRRVGNIDAAVLMRRSANMTARSSVASAEFRRARVRRRRPGCAAARLRERAEREARRENEHVDLRAKAPLAQVERDAGQAHDFVERLKRVLPQREQAHAWNST
jgi:hypothetical protein